jgi:hypothetical protein
MFLMLADRVGAVVFKVFRFLMVLQDGKDEREEEQW